MLTGTKTLSHRDCHVRQQPFRIPIIQFHTTHHRAFNLYSSLLYTEYREDAYLGWTGSAMRDFLLGRRLSRAQSIFSLLLILVGGWGDQSQHPSVKQVSVDTHTAERRVRDSNSQDSDTLAHGGQNCTILPMYSTAVNRILPLVSRVAGCQG